MIEQKIERSKQRVEQFAFCMPAEMPTDLLNYLDPFLPTKPPSNPPSTPLTTPLSDPATTPEADAYDTLNSTAASPPATNSAACCSHSSDLQNASVLNPMSSVASDHQQINRTQSSKDANLPQHRNSPSTATGQNATTSQYGTAAETKPCSDSTCTAYGQVPEEEDQAREAGEENVGDHTNACPPEQPFGDRSDSDNVESWLTYLIHRELAQEPKSTGYAVAETSQQDDQSVTDRDEGCAVDSSSKPDNTHSHIADQAGATAGNPSNPKSSDRPCSSEASTGIVPPVKLPPVPFGAMQSIGKLLPIETLPLALRDLPSIGIHPPTRQPPSPLDDLPCIGRNPSSGELPMPHGIPTPRLSSSPLTDSDVTAVSEPQQAAKENSKHSYGIRSCIADETETVTPPATAAVAAATAKRQAENTADRQAVVARSNSSSSSSDKTSGSKAAITVVTRGPKLAPHAKAHQLDSSIHSSATSPVSAVRPAAVTTSIPSSDVYTARAQSPASAVATKMPDSNASSDSSSVNVKIGVRKANSNRAGAKPLQSASPFNFSKAAAQSGGSSSSNSNHSVQSTKSRVKAKQGKACSPALVSTQADGSSAHTPALKDSPPNVERVDPANGPEQTKSRDSHAPSSSDVTAAACFSRNTSSSSSSMNASKDRSSTEHQGCSTAQGGLEPAGSAVARASSSWSHANVSRTKPNESSVSGTSASLHSSSTNLNSISAKPSSNSASLSSNSAILNCSFACSDSNSASLSSNFANPNSSSANLDSTSADITSSSANSSSTPATLTINCCTPGTNASNTCSAASRCKVANPSNGSAGVIQSGNPANVESKSTSKCSIASGFDFKRCVTSSNTTAKRRGHDSYKPSQAASKIADPTAIGSNTAAQPVVSDASPTDACMCQAQSLGEPSLSLTWTSVTETANMMVAATENSLNLLLQSNLEQALAASSRNGSPGEDVDCDEICRQAIDSGKTTQMLSATVRLAAKVVQQVGKLGHL